MIRPVLLPLLVSATLLASAPAWADRLGALEKNHPTVERGMRAYQEGRYEDALAAFEAAKREVPGAAELDHNIGDALYKLGRHEEAEKAWLRASAAAADKPALRQKEFFNLGNGYAAQGKDKEAIAMYRKALALDPTDEHARHNLEVLLRRIPPKPPPPEDGGTPDGGKDGGTDGGQDGGADGGQDGGTDAGQDGGQDGGTDGGGQDGGTDGGQDGGQGDAGAGDGGQDGGADAGEPQDAGGGDGGEGDGGAPDGGGDGGTDGGPGDGGAGDGGPSDGGTDGGPQDGGHGEGEGGGDGGRDGGTADAGGAEGSASGQDGGQADEVSRQEAENLLDSMRQNEKNHQLWRFQQRKKPRQPNEKDW